MFVITHTTTCDTFSRLQFDKFIQILAKCRDCRLDLTNPGLFQISFQYIWLDEPNVLKSDLKTSRICSIWGPIWSTLESNLPSLAKCTPTQTLFDDCPYRGQRESLLQCSPHCSNTKCEDAYLNDLSIYTQGACIMPVSTWSVMWVFLFNAMRIMSNDNHFTRLKQYKLIVTTHM